MIFYNLKIFLLQVNLLDILKEKKKLKYIYAKVLYFLFLQKGYLDQKGFNFL